MFESFLYWAGRSARTLVLCALSLFVAACATGTTKVEQPVTAKHSMTSVTFVKELDTVTVPDDVLAHFDKRLREYLHEEGPFEDGDQLTVKYRFTQFDQGNRALRYMIGFGAGKGTMTIDVGFYDPQGVKLADIDVGGELSVGFFGGDIDEAVSKAAKEVAEYTTITFHPGDPAPAE